ncbi:MAG: N-acetyltransferase [Clostridia bacterium]|nr:N-acetyltransferase [Clostridia bacterium]
MQSTAEMINVHEVVTARDKREFLNFPLRLYKDCPYFVPPLYIDEKKIFSPKYFYYDTCEAVYFLAERDNKTVGRISGILQKAHNEKTGEKRVRFTRFDSINDLEVASALFAAVEKWAKDKGMDIVCGPLGFSDLEREGLLIDGFDQLSTFEEQYNYDYYPSLVEACGYKKEVDWVERRITWPKKTDEKLVRVSEMILKKHGLKVGTAKNLNEFLKKYADGFFDLLDKTYVNIYGTVPFTEGMKKNMIDNFKIIMSLKYVSVIVDENDKVVCLAICFPSLSEPLVRSRGHLTPAAIYGILKSKRHPKVVDLGLIGVDPEYAMKGVSSTIFSTLMQGLEKENIEYAETNLNLEDNYNIQNQWRRFESVLHKRRRAYIKNI